MKIAIFQWIWVVGDCRAMKSGKSLWMNSEKASGSGAWWKLTLSSIVIFVFLFFLVVEEVA